MYSHNTHSNIQDSDETISEIMSYLNSDDDMVDENDYAIDYDTIVDTVHPRGYDYQANLLSLIKTLPDCTIDNSTSTLSLKPCHKLVSTLIQEGAIVNHTIIDSALQLEKYGMVGLLVTTSNYNYGTILLLSLIHI